MDYQPYASFRAVIRRALPIVLQAGIEPSRYPVPATEVSPFLPRETPLPQTVVVEASGQPERNSAQSLSQPGNTANSLVPARLEEPNPPNLSEMSSSIQFLDDSFNAQIAERLKTSATTQVAQDEVSIGETQERIRELMKVPQVQQSEEPNVHQEIETPEKLEFSPTPNPDKKKVEEVGQDDLRLARPYSQSPAAAQESQSSLQSLDSRSLTSKVGTGFLQGDKPEEFKDPLSVIPKIPVVKSDVARKSVLEESKTSSTAHKPPTLWKTPPLQQRRPLPTLLMLYGVKDDYLSKVKVGLTQEYESEIQYFECAEWNREGLDSSADVRVWTITLDPAIVRRRTRFQLQMEATRYYGLSTSHTFERNKTYRYFASDSLPNFLFGTLFENAQSDCKPVTEPAVQLSYFVLYLFRATDFKVTVPQLIVQFNRTFRAPLGVSPETLKGIHRKLNALVISKSPDLTDTLVCCIFGVLGLLKPNDFSKNEGLTTHAVLLSHINEHFLRQYSDSDITDSVLRSLKVHILANYSNGGLEWKSALTALQHSDQFEDIVKEVLKDLPYFKSAQVTTWLEVVRNLPSRQSCVCLEEILRKNPDFSSTVQVVQVLLCSVSERDQRRSWLQSCLNQPLGKRDITVLEVKTVLDALKAVPPNAKEVFYTLSSKITGLLTGKRCLSDTPETIDLLRRLLVLEFDQRLVQDLDQYRCIELLIRVHGFSFSSITSNLLSPKFDFSALCKVWLDGISQMHDPERVLKIVDEELHKISNPETAKTAAEFAVQKVLGRFESRGRSYLDLVSFCDSIQTFSLKSECVKVTETKLQNSDFRFQVQMSLNSPLNRLIHDWEKHKGSPTLRHLVTFCVHNCKPPTEEETIERLLKSPENEGCLILLLKHYSEFSGEDTPMTTAVLDQIVNFGRMIVDQTIIVNQLIRLQPFTPAQKEAFSSLITTSFQLRGIELVTSFESSVSNAQKMLKQRDEQFCTFSGFLAHIAVDMIGREALDQDLRNYMNDYKTRPLASFELPDGIGQLMQTAETLLPLFHSGLFKMYLRKQKAQVEFSQTTVQKLTSDARTQMFTYLDNLLVSIDSLRVSQILTDFSLVEDPKKEVMIINEVKPEFIEKSIRLYKCLNYHKKREELTEKCQMLIHLQELLNLSDEQILRQVDFYLKKMSQEGDLKVAELITLTEDTENLLYHQGNRSESLTAFQVLKEMQDLVFLQFLHNLNQVQIDNLIENVFNYDEAQLTTQVVLDLKNVWNFYIELKAKQQTYIQLVFSINSKLQDPQFRLLIGQLQQCKVHFKAIQELFINVERNEEAKKQQICAVVKAAKFSFKQGKGKDFDAEVIYETKRENRFNSVQILELRDRARLTIRTSRANSDDHQDVETLKTFVFLADVMEGIIKNLNELRAFGYPENLAAGLDFSCSQGDFEELNQFSNTLIGYKTDWEDGLNLAYEKNHLLTFLSGEQFWVLERYLLRRENAKEAKSLLGFIGRSVGEQILEEPGLSPSGRLQFLAQELNRLPTVPRVVTKVNYIVPILASITVARGGVLLYVESNKPLHALVSVYLHSGRQFPSPHQVIYCSRKTPWAELQAFLYRCYTSPIPGELYSLIGCEHLSQENQTKFIQFFRRVFSRNSEFSLAVITDDPNCPLGKFVQCTDNATVISVRENQIISDDEVMRRIIQQLDQSTVVVTSESAGLGKSRWIESQVNEPGVSLVKFPIAGDIHLDQLCARFLDSIQESTALHISINYVDSPSLLNDIISSISMFRTLSAGSLLIWFPPTCKVYIEVANLQPSLVHDLPYLQYLNGEKVEFQLSELIQDPEMSRVCAYLELYRLRMIDTQDPETVPVTKDMCLALLTHYFAEKQLKRGQPLSYLSLKAFLKVLHASISNMEKGPFGKDMIEFTIEELNSVVAAPENSSLRQTILKSLLKTTMEVTTKYVRSVLTQQASAVGDVENTVVSYECSLAWDQTNHFSMVFVEDGSFVCIYRQSEKVPGNIKKLLSTQLTILMHQEIVSHLDSAAYEIENFSYMSSKDLLDKLQTYCSSNAERLSEKFAGAEYVMTPDNFLKMNLIYLRAVSMLPIVIMGETGCGKTSLVRFFVSNVLKDEFRVVNIHAGVTSTHLNSLIQDIETCVEVLEIQEFDRSSARKRRLWVFFDEFNTSDCVGQICEVMCERSYLGRKLHENIVFIGACNPYRLKPAHMQESEEGIKKSGKYANLLTKRLMHLVKPLPESMIEYVWDFGALQPSDMKSYISTMLRKMESPELESRFTDLVVYAQDYFKRREDVSSVSLRDVARFVSLFLWFQDALPLRTQNRDKRFWTNLREYKIQGNATFDEVKLSAGLLALCYCYLYRISRREEQEFFLEALSRQAGIDVWRIEKLLEDNENDFIARMELPKGTALNKAFRQNVTCMIQCICNRTPLFICGKPGCSKSLAIQAVFASLRGNKSQDPYFMKLPDLIMVPFQGSETSTSEGVENAFGKAKRYLKAECKDILPVVVFDEIGLAEISKHNPLKVLHSLLEVENRDIAFIGVSNWRLDASKMNRALYLARPDPDEEELVFTALNIYQVCRSTGIGEIHHPLIKSLAETYSDFRNEQKTTQFPDFYGLRDFYSMVKQVSRALIAGNAYDSIHQSTIVKKAIARNFGGMKGAANRFGELLLDRFPQFQATFSYAPDASLLDLITENLADKEARFLMLIGKEEVGTYILEKYLEQKEQRRVLMGSHMSGDEAGDEYSFKSLSDIMLLMEKGISIVLKDMDHIYAALYDLFNQNFAVSGKRRYCRVALGALFNPRCLVHEDFHAIVFLSDDPETLSRTDAPFLNRFEKQSFDLDALFTERQVRIMDRIKEWVKNLMTPVGKEEVKITQNHVFPLLSEDYLKLLVLFKTSEQSSEDLNLQTCLVEMLRMAPIDVLVLSSISQLPVLEQMLLQDMWSHLHNSTFDDFLKATPGVGRKLLVFTYSTEFVNMDIDTKCVYFSSLKSKQDLTDELTTFFKSNTRIFVLDFNVSKDMTHISLAKFVTEEVANQFTDAGKTVCFLCRLMRNSPVYMKACWFEGWETNMFDDFDTKELHLIDVLEKTTKEVIVMDLFKFKDSIQDLTLKAFQQIQFKTGTAVLDQESINQHIFYITEQIVHYPLLIETLKTEVFHIIQQSRRTLKDWKYQVLCDTECVSKARNLHSAILSAVETEVSKVFTVLLFSIEKYQAFHSFFVSSEVETQLRNVWISTFRTLNYELALQTLSQSNRLNFDFLLDFPFSYKEYSLLEDLFQTYESNKFNGDATIIFESGLQAKTVFSQDLRESKPAFELYLRDMIKIHLVKTLLPMEYEPLILQFHIQWESSAGSFEAKILEFLIHRNFAASFCTLLDQFSALGSEKCKQEFQSVFSEKKIGMETLGQWIEGESLKLIPTSERLASAGDIASYAHLMQLVAGTLASLSQSYGCPLPVLANFKFWLEFTSLISEDKTQYRLLPDVLDKAHTFDTPELPFVYNYDFIQYIFSLFEDYKIAEVAQFRVFYHLLLLKNTPEQLLKVAQDFSTFPEMWKHSASLIRKIRDLTELESLHSQISRMSYTGGFDLPENRYIPIVETALEQLSLQSQFGVLLSDALYQSITHNFDANFYKDERIFQFLAENVTGDLGMYPRIVNLYAIASVRAYLDHYCEKILKCEEFHMKAIDELLTESPMAASLRVYCVKKMKEMTQWSNVEIAKFLYGVYGVTWIHQFAFGEQPYSEPDVFQVKNKQLYKELTIKFRLLVYSECAGDFLIPEIKKIESPDDKAAFALAALMQVFTLYNTHTDTSRVLRWVQIQTDMIRSKFGPRFSSLIQAFLSNFDESSCLRLTPESSREELHRILVMCGFLIVLCAYSDLESPMTRIFFNGSELPSFNNFYIYGAENDPLAEHLQGVFTNFNTMKSITWNKSYSKGSANRCSDTCKNVYFILGCGGAAVIDVCPFCGSSIGGTGHVLVPRPGHRNMSDEEAIEDISKSLTEFKANQPKGYKAFSTSGSGLLRNVSPLGYRVLHLFINLSLYFFYSSHAWTETEMMAILQRSGAETLEQYFNQVLKGDLASIFSTLNDPEAHLCIYSLLSNLPDFLTSHPSLPTTADIRDAFERSFDLELIKPIAENPAAIIQNYKEKAANEDSNCALIDEIVQGNMDLYKNYRLLRMTATPTFEVLELTFQRCQLQSQYPLLHLYFQKHADFDRMRCLLPLVNVTNYLLEKFNHMKTREEARGIKMIESLREDEHLSQLFTAFTAVWNEHCPSDLQLGCHPLQKKSFGEEDELLYFLVDSKANEGGAYMSAALTHFSDLQNSLLNLYLEIMKSQRHLNPELLISNVHYPVQKTTTNHIINLDLADPSFISLFCAVNPEYGHGKELCFDFASLETEIITCMRNAKFLHSADLDYIQYQFELLNLTGKHSALVSNIRNRYPQERLTKEVKGKVERMFTDMRREDNTEYTAFIRSVYSSLEYLLCFLQNAKCQSSTWILDFCASINSGKVNKYLKEPSVISILPISNIVELYELFEEAYFPYMKDSISPEFRGKESECEIERLCYRLVHKEVGTPTCYDVKAALRRLITRCLVGEIKATESISTYLMRPDFWREDVDEEEMETLRRECEYLPLAVILPLYEELERRISLQ